MDERVWRLPGPRSVIRDALREHRRRRHVAIVLPGPLAHDTALTDALTQELTVELRSSVDTKQVGADPDAGSLLAAIGRALVFDEYPPATVMDLLYHTDASGWVAVVVAADLPDKQQAELPDLLRRLETESRSAPNEARLTLVVIGSYEHLPHFAGGENSDVTVATVWWWNRVARWDVAAHISEVDETVIGHRLLADIRAETIVEVARWDLDLAEQLARDWAGDPAALIHCLTADEWRPVVGSVFGAWPGEAVVDDWHNLRVNGWHDAYSETAHTMASAPGELARRVWAAQSRILMPWIEERRVILQKRVVEIMGQRRFHEAVTNLFADGPLTDVGSIEVGPLRLLIDARLGTAQPKLRSAGRRLQYARNRLAHLTPLGLGELRELISACESVK